MEAEDFEIEAIWPPGVVRWGGGFGSGSGAAHKGTFGWGGHSVFSLPFRDQENFKIQPEKV
jgi:hypothetical protein